jgi:alanyl-tRNA synthetase
MKAVVNTAQRRAKMRAHTATHLLHYLLDTTLGGTKQAGSLVDDDYLRFDFATKQALTDQQILDIETTINHIIIQSLPVMVKEMSYDEATKTGAKAFFEDKYGDLVRVVSIQSPLTRGGAE